MSNEIKNRQHAIALIAPVPAAPFTTPIVSAVGVSGFVRNGAGNYTVALTDAAPFHTTRTSASLGANVLGTIGAQLAPDGGSVLVTAFDPFGIPFDPQFFDLAVDTIRDGEGVGPAPAPPAVPPPPAFGAGTTVLGWVKVNAVGAILAESASAVVASVDPWVGNASQIHLKPGIVCGAALATETQGNTPIVTFNTDVFGNFLNVRGAFIANAGPTQGQYMCVMFGL